MEEQKGNHIIFRDFSRGKKKKKAGAASAQHPVGSIAHSGDLLHLYTNTAAIELVT